MARRVSTVLLLLLAVIAAAAGQRNAIKDIPALHRLNERVITTAFTSRNEVVCIYCLFQVISSAYQLGNNDIRREITGALGSRRPDDLSRALLTAAESRSTLNGTLTGYYQRGSFNSCPTRSKPEQCASIARIVRDLGKSVDFRDQRTARDINSDVERATGGQIRNLFANIPANTKLVFASTLAFRDRWPMRLTPVPDKFRVAGASTDVRVPTLIYEADLPVLDGSSGDDVQGVSLPYEDRAIRLYCFTTTRDGSDIRDLLLPVHYRNLTAAPERFTQARLPKFDVVSKKYSYVDLVQLMGMREMFRGGLGPTDQLKVDQLVHKAVIQTDEHGTSAAGAAGISFIPLIGTPQPFILRFNKPFVCSLVDVKLEQPLFTAYIVDPRSQ